MIETLDLTITETKSSRINEIDFNNIQFAKIYSDHMFLADFKDGKWKDFRISPYDYLRITPANATLHYGQAIFEGLKAYKSPDGEVLIFRPLDNFKRMNISAERMCIPKVSEEIFMGGLTELLRLDKQWVPEKPGTSLYIRPFIFATDEYIGVKPSATFKFLIITCPVGAYYATPVKVKIETKYTRATQGGTGFAKTSGNYARSLYPAKLAQEKGYHQLIWTDGRDHTFIEEAGTMNVMFVIGDTLVTPALSESILAGVTRNSVLTLAKDWGLKVEERKVSVKEVIEAARNGDLKEAFGAGTAATIAHIESLGYEEEDFVLPPVEKREFSNRFLDALNEIRYGKGEDKFNWVYRV
jgi:branched-chain amino acid aminotransferase